MGGRHGRTCHRLYRNGEGGPPDDPVRPDAAGDLLGGAGLDAGGVAGGAGQQDLPRERGDRGDAAAAGGAPIALNAQPWPPYYLDDAKKPGFARELLQLCIGEMGYETRFSPLPIDAMYKALRNGVLDGHVFSPDKSRESFVVYGKAPLFSDAYRPVVAPDVVPEGAPTWSQPGGGVKTSAAWLIEQAGFGKGYGNDRVSLSTKHTLALTNRGTASTADLLARMAAGISKRPAQGL